MFELHAMSIMQYDAMPSLITYLTPLTFTSLFFHFLLSWAWESGFCVSSGATASRKNKSRLVRPLTFTAHALAWEMSERTNSDDQIWHLPIGTNLIGGEVFWAGPPVSFTESELMWKRDDRTRKQVAAALFLEKRVEFLFAEWEPVARL